MSSQADKSPTNDAAQVLKKPELFEAVVTRTNLKKRDIKPAVEAALAVIADALRDGSELNLPPLGKLRIVKSKHVGDGACVMTLKLRTAKNASIPAGNGPAVADDAD